MTPLALAGSGLLLSLALALAVWIVSIPLRDASLADRAWPWLIALPALLYAWMLPLGPRAALMLGLLLAWALRLGLYIWWRNRGHGEDRRYRAMRARSGPRFWLKSLWLVFGLQALLAWLVAMPMLAALCGTRALGPLDAAGALLAAGGLAFETVADAQLARFRRAAAAGRPHDERVLDRGLWRWSRHPNYFGEACVWWGLGAMALSAGGAATAWSLISPLLMTVLLLEVSGVALLEHDIAERRPAYRDYVARTSAFFPRPPRRCAAP